MLTNRSRLTRPAWVVLVLAATAALTGCTGGSDEAAPIPTIELTTTTELATTTTSEPTTTTEDSNLAEVREAYVYSHSYLETYGTAFDIEALEERFADPLLSRVVGRHQVYEDDGIEVGDYRYEIEILEIEVDGESALVTTCNLDAVSLEYPDGSEYVPADKVRYLRATELTLLENGWRVTDTGFGEEKTECAA